MLSQEEIRLAINRHLMAKWGEISPETRHTNEQAILDGGPVSSSHLSSKGIRFNLTSETTHGLMLFVAQIPGDD